MRKLGVAVAAGAGLTASVALVTRWDEWLNESHEHDEEHECNDGTKVRLGSCRPTGLGPLARGFASCIAYLSIIDIFLARRMRDDTSRYFLLHTLANLAISISSAKDMMSVLRDPLHNSLGKCNVLPTYMIPSLFAYHLSVFNNVPREEWEHHLIFGLGLSGPQLRYCIGPVQNALGFFMCGLPGGLDYAMLTAVKEGLMRSATEKVWNSRIQVWMRSPGILLASYAIYLAAKYADKNTKGPSKVLPLLCWLLASFNGQYYMQKVVANTAYKIDGQGAC